MWPPYTQGPNAGRLEAENQTAATTCASSPRVKLTRRRTLHLLLSQSAMHKLFDKTTKKIKKKAGKAMDLLRPPSRQSRSASPAPLRQAEDPTGLAVETESQRSDPTVTAAVLVTQPAPVSISDPSQRVESAATESAPPPANEATPTVPAFAEAPSAPTILATTGSALKEFLKAARDGSDLFLPLKAALVGVVALWDIFDVTPAILLSESC